MAHRRPRRTSEAGRQRRSSGSPGLLPLNILAFLLVVSCWYLASELLSKDGGLLPSPYAVLKSLWEEAAGGPLFAHIWASCFRVLTGFLLAVTVAIPIGFLMGWYRIARGLLEPLVQFLRTVPPIAVIPLVIFALGIDEEAKIFVIWLSSFLTLVVAVFQGVRNVDPTLIKAARVLGADDVSLFFDVVVPSSVPYIMVGARLGLGAAWATLVASEMVAAERGLGQMIWRAGQDAEIDVIILGVLIIGLLGLGMDRLVLLLERNLTSWQERVER